jgi:DNA repair protein RadC
MAAIGRLGRFCADQAALAVLILDPSQQVCAVRTSASSLLDAAKWLDDCILADPLAASRRGLVLLVNRPGGSTVPTPCDLAASQDARAVCRSRGVLLLDVLIVSGHRWRSLAETCDPSVG